MITGLYAAIAALFLIFLSFRVITQRRAKQVSIGDAGDRDLARAMRTHANFLEYVPLTLIMLGIAELNGLPVLYIHLFGIGMISSRVLHFIGISRNDASLRPRVIGMVMTFGILAILALIVAIQFLLGLLN